MGAKVQTERNITRIRKSLNIIVDETAIKTGSELIWLWVVVVKPNDKEIFAVDISKELKHVCIAERFLSPVYRQVWKTSRII